MFGPQCACNYVLRVWGGDMKAISPPSPLPLSPPPPPPPTQPKAHERCERCESRPRESSTCTYVVVATWHIPGETGVIGIH